ncbi:MAG: carboxypeptidase M32 [Acidobacteriota bacterium]|jgi:carboxypeptidase Taq
MPDDRKLFYSMAGTLHDLAEIQGLLEWDQQVMMPRRGAEQRANQMASLAGLMHQKATSPEAGDAILKMENRDDLTADERADVREARRAYDRAVKLPGELVQARAKAVAMAQSVWEEARPHNDFPTFKPHLEEVVKLTRETADALGGENRYDSLLEEFEPGMTEEHLQGLFKEIKTRLVPLIEAVRGAPGQPDASILRRSFPKGGQEAFCRSVVADMGYNMEAGRLDVSAHPFTIGTLADVRITTRYLEDFLPTALFGVIHEAGHALYEQGLAHERYRNPSGGSCSLGIHESQSRFWENMVGRSRSFWRHYYGPLKKQFPDALGDVNEDAFYRAVNTVKPSLIRVEADEATYNLHILVRFELESALLRGSLEAADLPEAWNTKMQSYLGVTPPDDRDGVLQDIHWSAGLIGYFPTYTLGNLFAAQFMETLRKDMPDLDDRVGRGELLPIRDWLRENIHQHGRRYLPGDLCIKVTGKPLSASASMDYLELKYRALYGL